MLSDVMEHFGLSKSLRQVDDFETEHHRQLLKDIKVAIHEGGIIALTGIVGSGKTVFLGRIQDQLRQEGQIEVAESLTFDVPRVNLDTLKLALYYDLATDKDGDLPSKTEKSERALMKVMRRCQKPIVLFVDDGHDVHGQTLRGLKQLIEKTSRRGARLTIVLAGPPRLKEERPMTTQDFIIALFYAVDQEMLDVPKHPEAKLYPSEVVTLALLFAVKGGGMRAFYRWLTRDYQPLFPQVPERTRLARLFKTHPAWTVRFLAAPTVLGVADSYGVELIHPRREGRRSAQIGKKGQSNHRWIVGGKLCFILNQWGLICAWDCATANVHDAHFHPLIAQFDEQMIVLTDTGFHAKTGDPANMKICPRGTWNTRMLVETVLSMLTTVFHSKKVGHRVWTYFRARLAWTMVAFNLLARWGLEIDDENMVRLSIAEFSL